MPICFNFDCTPPFIWSTEKRKIIHFMWELEENKKKKVT